VRLVRDPLFPEGNPRLQTRHGYKFPEGKRSRHKFIACTIEIIEPLAKRAEADLKRLGYNNVRVLARDGYLGWPDHAPFDAIIVTCAPDQIPQPLVEQLRVGGRMIIPVGPADNQQLYLLQKHGTKVEQQATLPVRLVPMKRAP
jgi:protein-L-isoaspartate(D-aspartate) O-methyltransferase